MKNKNLILLISFIIIGSGFILIKPSKSHYTREEKEENPAKPNEEFWIRRTYPNLVPDERAYFQALNKVKESISLRGTIPGFDDSWVVEGPGNIGARGNTIAVNPFNEKIILAGFSHGGIWKTINGGQDWYPVFDNQASLTIGTICFDPKNPSIIYAGTGDNNIPGGVFTGNGVYKSIDEGETWQNIGLMDEKLISKIQVDPVNTNIVYAATMGNPFQRDVNRGLYKSIDGGLSWNKILYIDNQTGITDMVINPINPQILFASSYTRIRTTYESLLVSAEAKVLRSLDGGMSWTSLANGLPLGTKHSRVGVALCKSAPENVYAIYVDSTYNLENLYRSTDNGNTWDIVPTVSNGVDGGLFGGFGWYFGKVFIDPNNPDIMHIPGVDMYSTTDGGNSWFLSAPAWYTYEVHADKHDLVYTNTGKVLLATDGGLYRTSDFQIWEDIENIPTTQFYRVEFNPHDPFNYYGGAQDNGTSRGNLSNINSWERVFGGDGFQPRFNPVDPLNYYYGVQNGDIYGTEDGSFFYNLLFDGTGFNIGERLNWDTPYIISNSNSNRLYIGGQKLYRSDNKGHDWVPVSEDLTGDVIQLGSTHTITSIDESKLDSNILFVGTGNGFLWRSTNMGISWDSVHQNGLPMRYLTSVHTSPSKKNTVYATFQGYKYNENMPHVFRSDNLGATWVDISSDLPQLGINDIYILPNGKDDELFVGTDGGVYGTINRGLHWERLGVNMPVVPVFDVDYNPVLNKIIAGTYARSIMSYSLDFVTFNNSPQNKLQELIVYPNPVVKDLHWNENLIGFQNPNAEVFDLSGKILISSISRLNDGKLDVNALSSGVYILKLKEGNKELTKKFIKL